MRDKLSQELASSTIRDALGRGNPTEGVIYHSDRGLKYASSWGPTNKTYSLRIR